MPIYTQHIACIQTNNIHDDNILSHEHKISNICYTHFNSLSIFLIFEKRPSQLKSLFINLLLLLQIKKTNSINFSCTFFSHSAVCVCVFALKVMAFSLLFSALLFVTVWFFILRFFCSLLFWLTFHSFCTILLNHREDSGVRARLCRMLSYYTHIQESKYSHGCHLKAFAKKSCIPRLVKKSSILRVYHRLDGIFFTSLTLSYISFYWKLIAVLQSYFIECDARL